MLLPEYNSLTSRLVCQNIPITAALQQDSPCYGRGAYSIRAAGSSHLEFNAKVVEPGQCSQTCDHCLGWNVTSRGYVVKDEPDKVTG